MIKRVSLAVITVAIGAAAALTPAAAHAASVTTNWGPNHNGWDVKLVNDWAQVRLTRTLFGNMHPFPKDELARGQSADLKGYRSVAGGPANADFVVTRQFGVGVPSQLIEVYLRATSSGNMSDSRCRLVRTGPRVGCSISRDASKQIVVRVWES